MASLTTEARPSRTSPVLKHRVAFLASSSAGDLPGDDDGRLLGMKRIEVTGSRLRGYNNPSCGRRDAISTSPGPP